MMQSSRRFQCRHLMSLLQVSVLLVLLSSSCCGCWAWRGESRSLRNNNIHHNNNINLQWVTLQRHRGIQQQSSGGPPMNGGASTSTPTAATMGKMTPAPSLLVTPSPTTPPPTLEPTLVPTPFPTPPPTFLPTPFPTPPPSIQATASPTIMPSSSPPVSSSPTVRATPFPTTFKPTTVAPTLEPTPSPFFTSSPPPTYFPVSPAPTRVIPLVSFAMNLTIVVVTSNFSVSTLSQPITGFMQSFLEQQLSSPFPFVQAIQLQLIGLDTPNNRRQQRTTRRSSRTLSSSLLSLSGQWEWRGVAVLVASAKTRTVKIQQVQEDILTQNISLLSNELQVFLLQDNIFDVSQNVIQTVVVNHVILNPGQTLPPSNMTTTNNTSSSSSVQNTNSSSSSSNVGLIVGLVCAGLVVSLVALLLVGPIRRYRRNLKVPPPPPSYPPPLAKCHSYNNNKVMGQDDDNDNDEDYHASALQRPSHYSSGDIIADKEQSSRVSTPSTIRETPTSTPEGVEVTSTAVAIPRSNSSAVAVAPRGGSGGVDGQDLMVTMSDRALQLVILDQQQQQQGRQQRGSSPPALALSRHPDYYAPRNDDTANTATAKIQPMGAAAEAASMTTDEAGTVSLATTSLDDDNYSLPAAESLHLNTPPGAYQWLKSVIANHNSLTPTSNKGPTQVQSGGGQHPDDAGDYDSVSSLGYDRVGSGSLEPTSSRDEDIIDVGIQLPPIVAGRSTTPTRANTTGANRNLMVLETRPSTSNDDDDEDDTDPTHPYRQLLTHSWHSPKRSMHKPGKDEQMLLDEMRLMSGGGDASLLSGSSLLSTSSSSSSSSLAAAAANRRSGKMQQMEAQASPPRPGDAASMLSVASRGRLLAQRRGADDTGTSSDVPSDEWNFEQEQDLDGFVAQIEGVKRDHNMLNHEDSDIDDEDDDDHLLAPPRLTHQNSDGAFRPNVSYLSSTSSSPPPPPPPPRTNRAASPPSLMTRMLQRRSPMSSQSPHTSRSPHSSRSRHSARPPLSGSGESSSKSSSGSSEKDGAEDESLSQFLRDRRRAKRASRKQREARKQPPISMEV